MSVQLKSVYEIPKKSDGKRYLIATFWPQELGTMDVMPFQWPKILAPSYRLWQSAKEGQWGPEVFAEAYRKELLRFDRQPWLAKIKEDSQRGIVTFLYTGPSADASPGATLAATLAGHPSAA